MSRQPSTGRLAFLGASPFPDALRAIFALGIASCLSMLVGCVEESTPTVSPEVKAPAESAPVDDAPAVIAPTERPDRAQLPEDSAQTESTRPARPLQETGAAVPVDKERLLDQTFDDIKFDIEPDAPYDRTMLTEGIAALDGQRIRIRGYILPTAQKRGIKQFVLVRDNQECCFGPGAALYDCILVEMQGSETAEFSVRPVAVEGRFLLSEFPGPDGRPLAIYLLEGEQVR